MARALQGVDVVCHQAAVVGAGVDADDAPAFASHNDFGTAVLLAAMHRVGCRRLVLASSMVVYGSGRYQCKTHGDVVPAPRRSSDLERGEFDDRCPIDGEPVGWELVGEDAALQPRSLYAASKLAQENFALAWSLASGGSVTALRYHNVYGEGMPRDTPYSGVAPCSARHWKQVRPPASTRTGGRPATSCMSTTWLRPMSGRWSVSYPGSSLSMSAPVNPSPLKKSPASCLELAGVQRPSLPVSTARGTFGTSWLIPPRRRAAGFHRLCLSG